MGPYIDASYLTEHKQDHELGDTITLATNSNLPYNLTDHHQNITTL